MKIIFLRHGETPYTCDGLAQGGSDIVVQNELTENGKQQVTASFQQIAPIVNGKTFI